MNRMRHWSKFGAYSGLLVILLIFSLSWSTDALASDRDGTTRLIKSATLHKRVGDTLFFVADRGGKIWKVKGKLSDQTQILNEKEEDINTEALDLGSVWTIKLQYQRQEGGLPVILEMKRIRSRLPE